MKPIPASLFRDLYDPTSVYQPNFSGGWYCTLGVKRLLDICGAGFLLLLLAPMIAMIWLYIRRDGAPGFFEQQRVGRQGVLFTCWKLRSMCHDADTDLHRYITNDPALAREWAVRQKLRNDPRITKIGKFIRTYSIDELPQLWNVFIGDMSFVGPRPFMPCQETLYTGDNTGYYSLRPGITGFWQVSERNDSGFAKRVFYDAQYARSVGFWVDLKTLLRTVRVVIRGTGH